jgi:hypothetical protein
MGAGGVQAVGRSIGQGLTAFSVFACGAPLTVAAIWLCARAGLNRVIHRVTPSRGTPASPAPFQ